MFNIIFVVLSLIISLGISAAMNRRQKGEDWYFPISNNDKMIMSTVNIAIILLIVTLSFGLLIEELKLFVAICILLFVITASILIYNFIENRKREKSTEKKKTIIEVFSKFLTIFNSIFFFLSILQICILATQGEKKFSFFSPTNDMLRTVFEKNNIFVISFTILLWTSGIGAITSFIGWTFKEEVAPVKKREKKDYVFYSNRVGNRNRKK